MILSENIKEALLTERKRRPFGPINVFNLSLELLKKSGYKQLTAKESFVEGDLISLNKDSDWIIVDDAKHLRLGLNRPNIGAMTVYRK